MNESVKEEVIKLLKQFNETGDIDIDAFVTEVNKHAFLRDHVYIIGSAGNVINMGQLIDVQVDYEQDWTVNNIKAFRHTGYTRQLRRNSDGSIKGII